MNAEQAKLIALDHRKRIDENFSIKKRDAHATEVGVLSDHFRRKIEDYVNKGALVTDAMQLLLK